LMVYYRRLSRGEHRGSPDVRASTEIYPYT